MSKTILEVSDSFSLLSDGRKMDANSRNYAIDSVQRTIDSNKFKEGLRLGELFGYYGHQGRQLAGKANIGEQEVVMIGGKPVVLTNVPSNVLTSIEISEQGIVNHTQEVFDTTSGQIVKAMMDAGRGGWSWATSGSDTPAKSTVNLLSGFDWVNQPNFISLERQQAMLESADANNLILESLGKSYDKDSAQSILNNWNNQNELGVLFDRAEQLQDEVLILEGVRYQNVLLNTQLKDVQELQLGLKRQLQATNDESSALILESLAKLPIILSDEQRKQMLVNPSVNGIALLFESMANTFAQGQLPHTNAKTQYGATPKRSNAKKHLEQVDFAAPTEF